jgi:hypothetical protein
MEVLYAHETLPTGPASPGIFLAGPSPRGKRHHDWRPEALDHLSRAGFEGTVYVPLPRDGEWTKEYDAQVDWELKHLDLATAIAFWVPRDLVDLPGFTTNVEFGLYARSGKVTLGFPVEAPKMRYLAHVARLNGIGVFHGMRETMEDAVRIACTDV